MTQRQDTPYPYVDEVTLRLIRAIAQQAGREDGLGPEDREDLAGELTLHVLSRQHRYDPRRGPWKGFVRHILDRKVTDLRRSREAQCREGERQPALAE